MKKVWFGMVACLITGSVFAGTTLYKPIVFKSSPWDFETGARVWFSTGAVGAPQPLLNYVPSGPNILASRLTYTDLNAYSGELFGRLDHSSGWFTKAFLGAGGITSGNVYDEDFPAQIVYSRTLSTGSGSLSYANIDLGHSLLNTEDSKTGMFLGYNYYAYHVTMTGCTQLAGDIVCLPGAIPPNYPGLAETDHFNSLRVGVTTQFSLTENLKLIGEAAYLPWVHYTGRDDHNARQLVGPENATLGNGMMLELLLNYSITNQWDVGVGGRYWAWNMRNGTADFDFLGQPAPAAVEPARFNAERYGVFVQTSYHPDNLFHADTAPIQDFHWSGLSLAGYLGGAWGNDQWSDPFISTPDPTFPLLNVSGFGDSIHATGPVGGVEVNYDWQRGGWVFGLGLDAAKTDIRGENTCFSGIGGVNCQRIVNSLATVTGRVGTTWEHSLFYAKAGGASAYTTFNLNGNTGAFALGTESTKSHAWGWTLGAGVEHALTNHWIALAEYDYVGIPARVVNFPSVQIVNEQNIRVSQSINLFKVGMKYKF